jgi:hypothetical protein
MIDEESHMGIDSRRAQARDRDIRFRYRLPHGYNYWFRQKALRRIRTWRSAKGPTVITTIAYLKTNRRI